MLTLCALPAVNISRKSCRTCKTNERREIIRALVDGQNFCAVFGWFLVDDHIIYKTSERSVRNITVS